jgi:hypothetical protein
MPVLCYHKSDTNPPLCGVHNVALVQNQFPIDAFAPQLGQITCFVCAVSRNVVQVRKRTYARNYF